VWQSEREGCDTDRILHQLLGNTAGKRVYTCAATDSSDWLALRRGVDGQHVVCITSEVVRTSLDASYRIWSQPSQQDEQAHI
jgi:hypothetical protein